MIYNEENSLTIKHLRAKSREIIVILIHFHSSKSMSLSFFGNRVTSFHSSILFSNRFIFFVMNSSKPGV